MAAMAVPAEHAARPGHVYLCHNGSNIRPAFRLVARNRLALGSQFTGNLHNLVMGLTYSP